MKIVTTKEEETIEAGEEFGKRLRGKDVVLLIGNLGAGKTTFVKGVAKTLGVPTRIISPTFVIARTHGTKHDKIKQMFHLDLYRLTSEEEVRQIDIQSMVDNESVVLIEWPELSFAFVKPPFYKVLIEYTENGRSISINYEE